MKAKELQIKPEGELTKMLGDLKARLHELRFDQSAKKLKNSSEINQTRKDIARIMTILNFKKNGTK